MSTGFQRRFGPASRIGETRTPFAARLPHERSLIAKVETAEFSSLYHRVLDGVFIACNGYADCWVSNKKLSERAGCSPARASTAVKDMSAIGVMFSVRDRSIATGRRLVLAGHEETDLVLRELASRAKIRRDNPWILPWAPSEQSGSPIPASG